MSSEDDDRTIIRPPSRNGQNQPVPTTGPRTSSAGTPAGLPMTTTQRTMPMTSVPTQVAAAPVAQQPHSLTLPPGTRLGEFEVTQTIGEGGFGIVYLAWDHSLDRKVAMKEYLPSSIAFRAGQTEIRPRSERHQETFDAGMKSFINEAKLLAQFDHPSLLKVYRFWEANGTAYMVMPFLEGLTLRDTVKAMPGPPDEAWMLGVLMPLFDALSMLHASQIYHRDIAPDNVLLMADTGRPLLLDFGAARRVIGDMTQALTAILKPGYAPVEQYADMPGLKQGPWTDVYALAAVVHWMILGKTPSPSVGRLFDDAYVPLAQSAAGRYSDGFLQAIDRALVVMPEKRTPSIDALRQDLLDGAAALPFIAPPSGGSIGGGHIASPVPRTGPRTGPPTQTQRGVTQQQPMPATQQGATQRPHEPQTQSPRTQNASRTEHLQASRDAGTRAADAPRSKAPLVIGAVVVLVIAAAGAAFALWPKPANIVQPAATVAPNTTTAPTTTPAVAPPTTATTPATPSTDAAAPQTPPPASTTVTPPATTAPTTTVPATTSPNTTSPARDTTAVDDGARPAARKPPVAKAETRERTPPATTRTTEAPKAAEPKPADDSRAECQRLFQRLSLGETDQSVIDRIRTLRCR